MSNSSPDQPMEVATPHVSAQKESRSRQTVTAEWNPVNPPPIDGVLLRDVKNVVYAKGALTELFRAEWFKEDEFVVRHVTLVTLLPGQTSQWHRHHEQRDIVFPIRGYIRIGLFDPRADSPTKGQSMMLTFNLARPRYLYIPPGVWHSLRNVGPDEGSYIVLNDTVFDYEKPDDWVLPPDSDLIPVRMDG